MSDPEVFYPDDVELPADTDEFGDMEDEDAVDDQDSD
jgi:hypothetical protein